MNSNVCPDCEQQNCICDGDDGEFCPICGAPLEHYQVDMGVEWEVWQTSCSESDCQYYRQDSFN